MAFVAQWVGMKYIGPFAYNASRFGLGAIVLIPFILIRTLKANQNQRSESHSSLMITIKGGMIAGLVIFAGASFQQVGLLYTTAGKAGFITGLYVILVPIYGIFLRQKIGNGTWIGAVLAVIGLYFLSVKGSFVMEKGDSLVLACAFVWAVHVHVIGRYSPHVDSIKLAFTQFAVAAILSLIVSLIWETTTLDAIGKAWIPIAYAGIFSAGIAFTLQVVAQRKSPPSHSAIIMSLEGVFAVLGGWLLLHESMDKRGAIGCGLMLAGMILSHFNFASKKDK